MCGIVGVFGDIAIPDLKFFKNALIADYVRGVHSTGIAACSPNEVEIKKLALDPINFLDLSSVKSMLTVQQHALIGHNRQATAGAVNHANAHPFEHGTITLVHNGTLTNKIALENLYDAPSFDTDSELVCWLIDNYELSSVIKSLEGAFALVWWDSLDNSINMINNGEREFHISVIAGTLYWASEELMLKWVLDRAGISDDNTKIISPKVGRYCKFTWSRKSGIETETADMELAPVKKRTPRIGGGGTTSTGKTSTTEYAAAAFGKEYGFTPKVGTKVYAYLNEVIYAYPSDPSRVRLECTLASHPYCPVTVFYAVDRADFTPDDLYGVELEVLSCASSNGQYKITGTNHGEKIVTITEKASAKIEAMDVWVMDNTPPFTTDEDAPEDLVSGYKGEMLPLKKFAAVLDRGCAVCASTFNVDAQIADRDCVFVNNDDVICAGCASSDSTVRYYGFDIGQQGALQ